MYNSNNNSNGLYISMMKDQRLNRNEDGLEELKHCFPYEIKI